MKNVGFAILSYNHPHITADCLNSVIGLTSADSILLGHNGSLVKHQHFLLESFPKIHHIQQESNKGFSGGANFLLQEAFKKWDWVYFLTNDTLLLNYGALPLIPGFYAPLIWRRKLGVMDSIGGGFNPKEQKLHHLKSIEEWGNQPEGVRLYIPGTAFLIHKEVMEKVGGFDETLHTYWEDVDFSMRVQDLNIPMKPHIDFVLLHKVGKTCHKDAFYTKELFHRNKEIISKRYLPE